MAASSVSWCCRRALGFLSQRVHQSCGVYFQKQNGQTDRHLRLGAIIALPSTQKSQSCSFHTSPSSRDLMEFFDRREVWGQPSVLCGRPWRQDELRLKSNQDLHKLWYVLLKERNMLLTMEAEYERIGELFPNPERMAKVEESMENILEVIQERDDAVSMLETGTSVDKGGYFVRDFLGRMVFRKRHEYAIPPHMNKVYRLMYPRVFKKQHVKYLALYREKIAKKRYAAYMKRKEENKKLIEKFPHLKGKLEEPSFKEPDVY